MPLKNLLVLLLALVMLAGLGWALFAGDDGGGPAFVSWNAGDEMPLDAAEIPPDPLAAELADQGLERVALEAAEIPVSNEPREVGVRGRVLDSYGRSLAGAQVVLEIGGSGGRRGGRNRIRKPVETGGDGRFEFRGQGVPGSTISLHLTHPAHAPDIVDSRFEDGKSELDVGDLTMLTGGTLVGSIINADGVGIPGASAQISPQRGNRLTWARNRNELLKPAETDRNGFFRIPHLRPGDYRIDASAPNHTRASSGVITLADLDEEELDPIRLGPGYCITGTVFSTSGQPVEGADLTLSRGAGRQRSDAQGQFVFDHLPASPVDLKVAAKGYVTHERRAVEPKDSAPLVVRLHSGLTITGVVMDGRTGAPVTSYAARPRRIGQLPERDQEQRAERMQQDMKRLEMMMVEISKRQAEEARDGAAGERAARLQSLEAEMRSVREKAVAVRTQLRDVEARPRDRGGRSERGGRPGSAGDVEEHAGGEFSFGGLDEGVYVVDIESPEHQSQRSEPVEVRVGGGNPRLAVALERGLHVTGTVTARASGRPLADARVELRAPPEESGGRGSNPGEQFWQSFRGRGRGNSVLSTRTDGQGRYALRHAPPGRYVVSVRADGHAESLSDAFELRAERGDLNFELGVLAVLRGVVAGIPSGQHGEVRVMAFGGPGNMKNAKVNSDGSYVLEDLAPGGYVVRAHLGSMRSFLSRELRTLMVGAQEGTVSFDVTLEEGDDQKFDPALSIPPVGEVVGGVVHNGLPGKGLQVSLRAVEENGGAAAEGSRENRRWRFLDGGFRNQTRTNQNGEFTFLEVPEGSYQLIVNSSQNRRQSLLTQDVFVRRDSRNEQRLSVFTAGLEGEIRTPDGAAASEIDGNIRLFAGVRERPQDPREFARTNTMLTVQVRDGRFESSEIPSGEYLLELSVRGRDRVEQLVSVGSGMVRLQLMAGPKRE